MAYPEGVTLQTVTVGRVINWQGEPGTLVISVTPVIGGNAAYIVHLATGTAMGASSLTVSSGGAAEASFQVPHTDLPGWAGPNLVSLDGVGWAYDVSVTATLPGGGKFGMKKRIVLPSAQSGPVDFELIPSGAEVAAPDGTPAVVLSVNGETGHVTVEGGSGAAEPVSWDDVQDKPATFPAASHSHETDDVDGLDDALEGKANAVTSAFIVRHNGTSWDFPTLEGAQLAGLADGQMVHFIGAPEPPAWARPGDLRTVVA